MDEKLTDDIRWPDDESQPHRRTSVRVSTRRPVHLCWGEAEQDAETIDISGGGLFVRSREPWPVGTPVTAMIDLGTDEAPLVFDCTVVRTVSDPWRSGMALRFVQGAPGGGRAALGQYLLGSIERDPGCAGCDEDALVLAATERRAREERAAAEELRLQALADSLAAREALLAAAEAALNDERARLGAECAHRREKLIQAARRLRETRSRLAERELAVEQREAAQAELGARMEQVQRQLQVHAFERNVLMQQVRELKGELEPPPPPHREERTQRIVFVRDHRPSDRVPEPLEEACRTPTAVRPVSMRMRLRRISARLREGVDGVWGMLNPWDGSD